MFHYFQIESFIHSNIQSYQCLALSFIEKLDTSDPYAKGNISIIKREFVRVSTESSNYKIITWVEDLQTVCSNAVISSKHVLLVIDLN